MKRPQTRSLMIFVVTNDATAVLPSLMSCEGKNYIQFTMHPRHVYTGPKPYLPKGKTELALRHPTQELKGCLERLNPRCAT